MVYTADEQEIHEANGKLLNAWSSHDIDTISYIQNESIGYGYRTQSIRINPNPDFKESIRKWFSTMKDFTMVSEEENCRAMGDTGLSWGTFTEKIVEHDDTVRYVKVRYTTT